MSDDFFDNTEEQTSQQELGSFVAEVMEKVGNDYPNAELSDILIVTMLESVDEDGDTVTTMLIRCTDGRSYVQRGILESAIDVSSPR